MAPRVVAHRQLADAEAGGDRQGRDECLEQFHRAHRGADLPAHDAELAAGVVNNIGQDGAPDRICQPRHHPAQEGILTVDPPPADQVKPARLDQIEQRRKIPGVVLPVAVHREDPLPARLLQTGEQGGRLAGMGRQPQLAAGGPARGGSGDLGRGRICASIVDEDDLVGLPVRREHVHRAGDEVRDIARLVVQGHDEGMARVHGRGV